MDISEDIPDMTSGTPHGWQPWQPKVDALSIAKFPSEEKLRALRERIPAEGQVFYYTEGNYGNELGNHVRESIPTLAEVQKLQESIHAITDVNFTLWDLAEATYQLKIDQRYDCNYGISPEGEASIITAGSEDQYQGHLSAGTDGGILLERSLRKLFSKKELFEPLCRLK
jgi:hypothetical protein